MCSWVVPIDNLPFRTNVFVYREPQPPSHDNRAVHRPQAISFMLSWFTSGSVPPAHKERIPGPWFKTFGFWRERSCRHLKPVHPCYPIPNSRYSNDVHGTALIDSLIICTMLKLRPTASPVRPSHNNMVCLATWLPLSPQPLTYIKLSKEQV